MALFYLPLGIFVNQFPARLGPFPPYGAKCPLCKGFRPSLPATLAERLCRLPVICRHAALVLAGLALGPAVIHVSVPAIIAHAAFWGLSPGASGKQWYAAIAARYRFGF